MRFWRAHGLGNDYLVLEEGGPLTPALIRAICDRNRGIGSDGILEPGATPEGTRHLRIWNPDGSEAEKSGNGLRIFAAWCHLVGQAPAEFPVLTAGGRVACRVLSAERPLDIEVEMGRATVASPESLDGLSFNRVSVGNPHMVVRGIPADWMEIGARLEHSVPGRTNVQFVEVLDRHRLRARIWERGAGHTLSSGSSACAVAAAFVASGAARSPVTVEMEGGSLEITVSPDLDLRMRGPVEPICRIVVEPSWAEAHR